MRHPESFYYYPLECHRWLLRSNFTTPEGVNLEIRTYTYYVGIFYRRQLIAAVRCRDIVRGIIDCQDGTFLVNIPNGALIRVHYDHIEHICGDVDKELVIINDFMPHEVIAYCERIAHEKDNARNEISHLSEVIEKPMNDEHPEALWDNNYAKLCEGGMGRGFFVLS